MDGEWQCGIPVMAINALPVIPIKQSFLVDSNRITTREWYNFFNELLRLLAQGDSASDAVIADIIARIQALENEGSFLIQGLGSIQVDGTPENGIVQLSLVNDVQNPGNTFYYGTGPTGQKGWFSIASAFTATLPGIQIITGSNGVTNIQARDDLAALEAIATTGFAVRTAANAWTTRAIGGTTNRITVTNGDGVAGAPVIDISASYAGQTSITTLGTITVGTWNGTAIAASFGGTGQTTYVVGDLLYASATNALSRRAIGTTNQILSVNGGLPTWQNIGTLIPSSGVVAGTYGDARHIPVVTVNAQGFVTAMALKAVCPFDSTGLISGGALSIGSPTSTFSVSAGVSMYMDYTNPNEPEQILVPFGPFSNQTIPGIGTRLATYIGISNAGVIVQSATPFTNAQRRSITSLGAVIHSNMAIVNATNDISSTVRSNGNQVQDLMQAIGPLNLTGNVYSANGANLNIDKTAGTIFKFGSNFHTNVDDPHSVSLVAGTAITFRYRTSTGVETADTTSILPNVYESAPGVLTAVPALINTWHIQRISIFQSGLTRIQYGQAVYASMGSAIDGIQTEAFTTETNIAENGILRCYLVINRGILGLLGNSQFVAVTKFGGISSGGIALTFANIVSALGYTPQPQDATLTALSGADWAANALPIGTGADTLTQTAFAANTFPARASAGNLVAKPITDFGLSLVDDVDAATARITLGAMSIPTAYIDGLRLTWNSASSLSVSTGSAYIPASGIVINSNSMITKSSLSLAASTWYHIYLFLNSGVPDIEIVTTAPSSAYFGSARTKSGDTSRRYIWSVKTDAAGGIFQFKIDSTGLHRYLLGNALFRVLSNGQSTVARTQINCGAFMPVTSTAAIFQYDNTTEPSVFVNLSNPESTVSSMVGISPKASNITAFPTDNSQKVDYFYSTTPTGGFYLDVVGFAIDR